MIYMAVDQTDWSTIILFVSRDKQKVIDYARKENDERWPIHKRICNNHGWPGAREETVKTVCVVEIPYEEETSAEVGDHDLVVKEKY